MAGLGVQQRVEPAPVQRHIGHGVSRGAAAAPGRPLAAVQRYGDFVGDRHRGRLLIGWGDGMAVHIHPGLIVRPSHAGACRAAIQQRVGLVGLGHGAGRRGSRRQQHQKGAYLREIKLRLLHCNIVRYFVTPAAGHYINQPIKERDRARTAKFGENSKAGALGSGLFVLG